MGVCVQGVQAAVVTPACGCNVPEGSTGRDRAVFNLDTLLRLPEFRHSAKTPRTGHTYHCERENDGLYY